MTNTSGKSGYKKIVIFGAGKIGRSFIGQLFSHNGYNLVFVDKNKNLVDELNRYKKYRIVVRANPDYVIEVKNFRGIYFNDMEAVKKALAVADLAATSVGKNAFEEVMVMIAEGLEERFKKNPDWPLDIILGENIINAGQIASEILSKQSGGRFPISRFVGLVETSIGKMVPILSHELETREPLIVYTESYNTLILEKKAFKNQAPEFSGLQLVDNIEAWVYRKALIHNLGHVAIAYFGYFYSPESRYIADLLELPAVFQFGSDVMNAAARILHVAYPDDFTIAELEDHVNELLSRFKNKMLGDTIFRVGCDLFRKFGPNDRIFGAIKLAEKYNLPYNLFCQVAAYGLFFRATDEDGNYFKNDKAAIGEIMSDPEHFLIHLTGLSENNQVINLIMMYYSEFKTKHQ